MSHWLAHSFHGKAPESRNRRRRHAEATSPRPLPSDAPCPMPRSYRSTGVRAMLMTTPHLVFIRGVSVGCPLHMLRAGNFRNPSLACAVMKCRHGTLGYPVSAQSFACTASRRSSSSRAYLATTHILELRFRKVIPGYPSNFRGDDIDSTARSPADRAPRRPSSLPGSRTAVGGSGDLAGDRADQGGGPAALRWAGPPLSRIRSVRSGRCRRRW